MQISKITELKSGTRLATNNNRNYFFFNIKQHFYAAFFMSIMQILPKAFIKKNLYLWIIKITKREHK